MANKQIKDLTERTAPAETDVLPVDDASNVTYKVQLANLFANRNIRSFTSSLADDTAMSVTPSVDPGMLLITGGAASGGYGLIYYSCTGGAITGMTLGAATVVSTGALTNGTADGTDAKLNINAHTDGKVYIKNRLGVTITVRATLF